jgi:hypothetical protein
MSQEILNEENVEQLNHLEENILKENPNRFVIFQYNIMIYGNFTKKLRLVFGLLKRLICNKIYLIGRH